MRDTTLVCGGAGFIGSHLCDALVGVGQAVICLDNLTTGRIANISHLIGREDFSFVEHDITQPLPALPPVSAVYHLASPASPPAYVKRQIATLRANSEGTFRLLELAAAGESRFLYCSTSEVYGDPLEHPQQESYRGNVSSTGPRSMYDEAKRYGEALTMAYVRSRAIDARIVRLFNTYGPRADPNDGRLVPNFVMQALRGDPIVVYGTGHQTRSLCYVSDTVLGIQLAMSQPGTRGEVINIGNPDERTVLEYASLIREMTASASQIAFAPVEVGDDPQRRRPDITRARTMLGWQPSVDIHTGLRATIDWFRGAPVDERDAGGDVSPHRMEAR